MPKRSLIFDLATGALDPEIVKALPQTARLTAADVVFTSTTTLATVLQLTGLVAGATYWVEIGARCQDDGSTSNVKLQCAEAKDGGSLISYDDQSGAVIAQIPPNALEFPTTGCSTNLTGAAVMKFCWEGWAVAAGGGTITLKAAQLVSSVDSVTFFTTSNVDATGALGNTYIRAQKL